MCNRMEIGCGVLTAVIILLCLDLCSGTTFLGPENKVTAEGANHFPVLCQSFPAQATPFWKINGTTYYFSNVPPPFEVSNNGREIYIPLVTLSLNGTSFQCFIPSSSEAGSLFSSSIGVLTVTPNGHLQAPESYNPRPKVDIVHQTLSFSPTSLNIMWKAFNEERCTYYRLVVKHSCDADSASMVLINHTKENNIALDSEALSDAMYFSLTTYDEGGNQCEDLSLEPFRFNTEITTEEVSLCSDNGSKLCMLTPTCINVPPVHSGRQTLVLALPFLPATSELEEDLLCPVHLLPGERCVDLLSCNRFRGSAYTSSITICRAKNDSSVLEMCFHNVTDNINGTRLHFFYSDLHCRPDGTRPQSTRTYVKSVQLVVTQMFSVTVSDSEICIISNCNQDCMKLFRISIRDKFGCTTFHQHVSNDSCTSFTTLQLNAACGPYHVNIQDDNSNQIYSGSITDFVSFLPPSSECTCSDSSQSTTSTQSLAIGVCAIFGVIILILFVAIIAVTHRNCRVISKQ